MSGSLLMLDRRALDVLEVQPDGQARGVLEGRVSPSDAPRAPHSLLPVDEERWILVDRTDKWKVLKYADGALMLQTTLPTGLRPERACSSGGYVVAKGYSPNGNNLHVFDLSGTPVGSFHPLVSHVSTLVRQQVSGGLLACTSTGVVVSVSSLAPVVYGYSLDGTLLWATYLEGLDVASVSYGTTAWNTYAVKRQPSSARLDSPASLIPLSDGKMLFQFVRRLVSATPSNELDVRSLLIDTATGAVTGLGSSLPLFLGSSGKELYGTATRDRPVIGVYGWEGI
jgi:hypothetical protein